MADLFDILLAKNLAGGVKPQGEINITKNGEYDVAEYAMARVNVPVIIPKVSSESILRIETNSRFYEE